MSEAYNKGEPILWEKVHLLPDHVKVQSRGSYSEPVKTVTSVMVQVEQMEVVKSAQQYVHGMVCAVSSST